MTHDKCGDRPGLFRQPGAWGLALALCALGLPGSARAGTYALDQRFASIEFSVDNIGLFTSEGQFKRFQSSLTIDEAHPERSQIDVDVDAGSVDMFWEEGVAMLRSPEYFDVQHFPDVRFKSSAIEPVSPDRYIIHGVLEIRRILQPCVLEAKMVGRHFDAARHIEIADFIASGELKRSIFGMVADRGFISDVVKLKITAHIQLTPVANAE